MFRENREKYNNRDLDSKSLSFEEEIIELRCFFELDHPDKCIKEMCDSFEKITTSNVVQDDFSNVVQGFLDELKGYKDFEEKFFEKRLDDRNDNKENIQKLVWNIFLKYAYRFVLEYDAEKANSRHAQYFNHTYKLYIGLIDFQQDHIYKYQNHGILSFCHFKLGIIYNDTASQLESEKIIKNTSQCAEIRKHYGLAMTHLGTALTFSNVDSGAKNSQKNMYIKALLNQGRFLQQQAKSVNGFDQTWLNEAFDCYEKAMRVAHDPHQKHKLGQAQIQMAEAIKYCCMGLQGAYVQGSYNEEKATEIRKQNQKYTKDQFTPYVYYNVDIARLHFLLLGTSNFLIGYNKMGLLEEEIYSYYKQELKIIIKEVGVYFSKLRDQLIENTINSIEELTKVADKSLTEVDKSLESLNTKDKVEIQEGLAVFSDTISSKLISIKTELNKFIHEDGHILAKDQQRSDLDYSTYSNKRKQPGFSPVEIKSEGGRTTTMPDSRYSSYQQYPASAPDSHHSSYQQYPASTPDSRHSSYGQYSASKRDDRRQEYFSPGFWQSKRDDRRQESSSGSYQRGTWQQVGIKEEPGRERTTTTHQQHYQQHFDSSGKRRQ